MKDKGRLLPIGIGLAILTAICAYFLLRYSLELVPVVVAADTIEARAPITADKVKIVEIPANGKHANAFQDKQLVIGQYTTKPIYTGEQIITQSLATQGSDSMGAAIPKANLRVVGVPMDDYTSFGGKIKKGDRVDIMASYKKDDGLGAVFAKVFLQQVEIFDIGSSERDGRKVVLLLLKLDEAEHVILAQRTGQLVFALNPVNAQPYGTNGAYATSFLNRMGLMVK